MFKAKIKDTGTLDPPPAPLDAAQSVDVVQRPQRETKITKTLHATCRKTARPGGAPAAAGARESHASAPRAHTGIDRDRTVDRLGPVPGP